MSQSRRFWIDSLCYKYFGRFSFCFFFFSREKKKKWGLGQRPRLALDTPLGKKALPIPGSQIIIKDNNRKREVGFMKLAEALALRSDLQNMPSSL